MEDPQRHLVAADHGLHAVKNADLHGAGPANLATMPMIDLLVTRRHARPAIAGSERIVKFPGARP